MRIKVALPKGRLLDDTAALLQKANWGLEGYDREMRLYHLRSLFHNLAVKVFHEKDIPIQVAVGNYDLGICGLDWVEELLAKYPSVGLVKVKDLGFGERALYMAAPPATPTLEQMKAGRIRIASEYPNLAESFALKNRLARFSIFPVWGGAEAYPPENADLALVSSRNEAELAGCGLVPISRVLDFSAFLIANKNSWESKDLFQVVSTIPAEPPVAKKPSTRMAKRPEVHYPAVADGTVRLALPDGHQQSPTAELLSKAGIKIEDYPSPSGNRRPTISRNGVVVKVIRPQDMPLQVANGNFDLAITGRDWLTEHLYQFPSSPVRELLDLKFGWVKLVAVVGQSAATDIDGLRQFTCARMVPLRVASEYTNIADKYARDNHLGPYRVIPTWGATEAFLPEDADLLIENTQTGSTIARHKLKIIDTLFESTACLIGNVNSMSSPAKRDAISSIVKTLQAAVEES